MKAKTFLLRNIYLKYLLPRISHLVFNIIWEIIMCQKLLNHNIYCKNFVLLVSLHAHVHALVPSVYMCVCAHSVLHACMHAYIMLSCILDTCSMRRPPVLRTKKEVMEKIALLEVTICNSNIKLFVAISPLLVSCSRSFVSRQMSGSCYSLTPILFQVT